MAGAFIFMGFCLVFAAFIIVSVRIYQVKPDFIKKVLKYALIFTFAVIFSIISLTIGFRIDDRHSSSYSKNYKSVRGIWGGQTYQSLPSFSFKRKIMKEFTNQKTGEVKKTPTVINRNMGISDQKISVKINSNIRTKGLLKYPGFNMEFSGKFVLKNLKKGREAVAFNFQLPQNAGNITDLKVKFQGKKYTEDSDFSDGVQWSGSLAGGEQRTVEVFYRAQGTERFVYSMGNTKREIKSLDMTLVTDFSEVIIPDGAMVPTDTSGDDNLSKYTWKSANLVTGQDISLKFIIPGNYGKTISRMFYYAPIAIFLFLAVLVIFVTAREIKFHPMNYLFLLTGFFIFYLLGSYVVTYMPIIPAIALSLAVSTGIMAYYIHIIKKGPELLRLVLFGALLFQWIFSSAFFLPEHTGFLITVTSILSFIFIIKATAKVDWENKW